MKYELLGMLLCNLAKNKLTDTLLGAHYKSERETKIVLWLTKVTYQHIIVLNVCFYRSLSHRLPARYQPSLINT